MRKRIEEQMIIGEIEIADIRINLRSRDEIPKTLLGIQEIYNDKDLLSSIFNILESEIKPEVAKNFGRPGMELWKILVLGVIRLVCNIDYDKLHEYANEHLTIRKFLGHSPFDEEKCYAVQTLKDNISLLTPELLDKINREIVKFGRDKVFKKKRRKSKPDAIHSRWNEIFIFQQT